MKYEFVVIPTLEITESFFSDVKKRLKFILHKNIKININGILYKDDFFIVEFFFADYIIRLNLIIVDEEYYECKIDFGSTDNFPVDRELLKEKHRKIKYVIYTESYNELYQGVLIAYIVADLLDGVAEGDNSDYYPYIKADRYYTAKELFSYLDYYK